MAGAGGAEVHAFGDAVVFAEGVGAVDVHESGEADGVAVEGFLGDGFAVGLLGLVAGGACIRIGASCGRRGWFLDRSRARCGCPR